MVGATVALAVAIEEASK
ncbi:MAG TPA: hypothetical protein PLR69_03980 [Candidatus Limiplasma sp.]|nr:hypothetical protein [Candidatus Limiplasma sp.]